MKPTIRDAGENDLAAINEIYNHYVLNSTATFHEQPVSLATRRAGWAAQGRSFPVLAAGEEGDVLGWAALSKYSERCAYRFTVSSAIYLRPEACGRGLGTALLAALLERGRVAGFHSVVAMIAADGQASLRLHERLGFREAGRLREVGYKFGRWIDVVVMQRAL